MSWLLVAAVSGRHRSHLHTLARSPLHSFSEYLMAKDGIEPPTQRTFHSPAWVGWIERQADVNWVCGRSPSGPAAANERYGQLAGADPTIPVSREPSGFWDLYSIFAEV